MNKYYFVYLVWLLPIYFVYQFGYQATTYFGIQNTYENGESYIATVTDFDVKQIAAQTNGYVVIQFTTNDNEVIEEQLGLPVQMAQVIMESELIPVRYNTESFKPIVLMPTYELQQSVIKVNLGVTAIGLVVTIIIALYGSRYAYRRIKHGEEQLQFERIDRDEEYEKA